MDIKEMAVTTASKVGFVLKENAPQIVTGIGIVAGITSTVLAIKGTPKAMKVADRLADELATVQECKDTRNENFEVIHADGTRDTYTDKDAIQDKIHFYTVAGVDVMKAYWPAVLAMGVSVFCTIKGQKISMERNAALAAAYTAIDQSFKEYRRRVQAAVGEDKESDIYMGVHSEKIKNEETGKKETIKVVDKNAPVATYARWFDSSNSNYSDEDHDYNMDFIQGVENYYNQKLRTEGHVFLNQVYHALGFEDTAAGAVVGWLYKPTEEDEDGDGYITLRPSINVTSDLDTIDDAAIYIDPNVDGIIINGLPKD